MVAKMDIDSQYKQVMDDFAAEMTFQLYRPNQLYYYLTNDLATYKLKLEEWEREYKTWKTEKEARRDLERAIKIQRDYEKGKDVS